MPHRTGDGSAAPPSVAAGDVTAQLDRILASPEFRHSERLCRFLAFVVTQHLAGNITSLKQSVVAVEVFDREPSYDSSSDSVVRVEARRLREKLGQYYDGAGKNDPLVITLPKGSYAPQINPRGEPPVVPPTILGEAIAARKPQRAWVTGLAVAGAVLAGAFLMSWWGGSRQGQAPAPIRRLTSDAGLTFQPVLSNDGKLMAFSSDRSGDGNLDIWVQQIPGGTPVRITDNPADDVEPAFSPDGTSIAYRADGAENGVFVVPALGGAKTLLAKAGYRPRFSPDGSRVVYWTGDRLFRMGKIFVVPAHGGAPVPFQADFAYAGYPLWSPDGLHIAFVGSRGSAIREESNTDEWDWWVAPVDGGPAVAMLAREVFDKQGLQAPETGRSHRRVGPEYWSPSGNIVFSARRERQTNIWQVPVSRRWQVNGTVEPLTFGAGRADHPSMAADGSMVFSVLTYKCDVWRLALGSNGVTQARSAERVTTGDGNYVRPTVSQDGKRIAFLSNRSGNNDVWVKELETGREHPLTASPEDETAPTLAPDGSRVAFSKAPAQDSILLASFEGGPVTSLCTDCGEPRAWLPDGKALLFQRLLPKGGSVIGMVDLSGHAEHVLQSAESALFSPSVSRDSKWIAVTVRTPPDDDRIAIVPLRRNALVKPSDWIWITHHEGKVNKPRWSPDGGVLYFVSDWDGFVCIWACRLDPATKRPVGQPEPVLHFHSGQNSLDDVYGLDLTVASGHLFFNAGARSGNIWLAASRK
ncbi:hypothetical protein [uncultured Paludibaculum sp.]|uniref:hypothetical protein n=1 Tax=uncultured Paludibaculum sp. TaxID=1765020 RepID=UPI002AAB2A6E|nr:hypothetical protein [uncultured Paludibaculum sp.]